ncbi:DMT family transporter [Paenibacillus hamazuiensis]|uniref:DMT family transporter n=1 Tax=Paenibacillus hamazuiensis TaxID=2936508 RepID=UPI00200F2E0C|nr:DMT family transporter [Paenibacillus hamazuiensis]
MTRRPGTVQFGLIYFTGIVAISFSSIFIRWSEAPVSVLGMYRLLFTVILMSPFIRPYISEIRGLTPKQWGLLLLSGSALGLHFLFWMGSLRYTSVASSTVLMTLEPVLVMAGAYIFFGEKASRQTVVGMAVAVSGAMMISWGDFGLSLRALQGDLLSLLGTAAVAVHMLLGQRLRRHVSSYVYSLLVFAVAAAVFALYNAAAGYSFVHYEAREWGLFALLAVVPTVFGHLLFNWLLKYMNAASVSMSVLGEPVGSTLLAFWLLGEPVGVFQLFAGLVMLAGVWIFIDSGSRRRSTP